jgi:hypothetical protein
LTKGAERRPCVRACRGAEKSASLSVAAAQRAPLYAGFGEAPRGQRGRSAAAASNDGSPGCAPPAPSAPCTTRARRASRRHHRRDARRGRSFCHSPTSFAPVRHPSALRGEGRHLRRPAADSFHKRVLTRSARTQRSARNPAKRMEPSEAHGTQRRVVCACPGRRFEEKAAVPRAIVLDPNRAPEHAPGGCTEVSARSTGVHAGARVHDPAVRAGGRTLHLLASNRPATSHATSCDRNAGDRRAMPDGSRSLQTRGRGTVEARQRHGRGTVEAR